MARRHMKLSLGNKGLWQLEIPSTKNMSEVAIDISKNKLICLGTSLTIRFILLSSILMPLFIRSRLASNQFQFATAIVATKQVNRFGV
jgi:hypothetical protein